MVDSVIRPKKSPKCSGLREDCGVVPTKSNAMLTVWPILTIDLGKMGIYHFGQNSKESEGA